MSNLHDWRACKVLRVHCEHRRALVAFPLEFRSVNFQGEAFLVSRIDNSVNSQFPHLPSCQGNPFKAEFRAHRPIRRFQMNPSPPPQALKIPSEDIESSDGEARPSVGALVIEVGVNKSRGIVHALDALIHCQAVVFPPRRAYMVVDLANEMHQGLISRVFAFPERHAEFNINKVFL